MIDHVLRLRMQILGLIVTRWVGYLLFQHFLVKIMSERGSDSWRDARPCTKQEGGGLGMVLYVMCVPWAGFRACSDAEALSCTLIVKEGVQVGLHSWQMCARALDVFSLIREWLNVQSLVTTHCGNHKEEGLLDRKQRQGQISKCH